jgi:hypothetical protein
VPLFFRVEPPFSAEKRSSSEDSPMLHRGFHRVSPCAALTTGLLEVRPAGVAQLVEHLFCKQVVRGSSPLASSVRRGLLSRLEGCPSGQREQAVNLPAYAYVGSNPTPSTGLLLSASGAVGASSAGVAQLVERQPSKLNVVGSNPISRSARLALRAPTAPRPLPVAALAARPITAKLSALENSRTRQPNSSPT